MGYLVFARRYRPQTFDEVIGQEHITRMLAGSIAANRIGHAYLFSGPRGVGKTSTARILAKALNCVTGPTATPCNQCDNCTSITEGSNLDIIEIDAASNRGIDDIRQLREYVRLVPTGGSRYKVYIIDEVHMLTPEAFNALLKTLEEPPAHAIFVLATTEKQKVPATIISRCQQCDFKRISVANIVKQLDRIVSSEPSIEISNDEKQAILYTVARSASGSMRDAESLFDQLISFTGGKPTLEQTIALLGTIPSQILYELLEHVAAQEIPAAIMKLDALIDQGIEYETFLDDMLQYVRSLMLLQVVDANSPQLDLTDEEKHLRIEQSKKFKLSQLLQMMKLTTAAKEQLRKTIPGRVVIEMLILDFIELKQTIPLPELVDRVKSLQKQGERGNPIPSSGSGANSADLFKGQPESAEPNLEKKTVPTFEVSGESTLSAFISHWDDIRKVISQTKPTLSAHLSDAQPLRIDGDTLVLGFQNANGFHKRAVEQPESRQLVESVITRMCGKSFRIKGELIAAAPKPEKTVPIPIVQPKARPEEAVLQEPTIKKIINLFGISDVKVKKKLGIEEKPENY
ncbi:MAG: DNA polymerase III subunit gamma/tau [bacterium]|nr:DNA polymerase III subunit gamma/tau [bacterium]